MYADDNNTTGQELHNLRETIKTVEIWANSSKMFINKKKSKIMFIENQKKFNKWEIENGKKFEGY